jgi:hypothetical protein
MVIVTWGSSRCGSRDHHKLWDFDLLDPSKVAPDPPGEVGGMTPEPCP